MIVIIDYGMGNLGSLKNMFKAINQKVSIESCPKQISSAKKLVLPGVGNFDKAMSLINKTDGLRDIIIDKASNQKVPVLGICLGMQILLDSSEEGEMKGLGLIEGESIRFPAKKTLKVPHMGWNSVVSSGFNDHFCSDLSLDTRYYFAHSYYARVKNTKHTMMKTKYSLEFDSAICRENIFGVQFHPEKSHRFGMNILEKFSSLN
jgi:glutamine amidotransferase